MSLIEEEQEYYEQGGKLVDDYIKYKDKLEEIQIQNEEVIHKIDKFLSGIQTIKISQASIWQDCDEIEREIHKDLKNTSLMEIRAIQRISELIRLKKREETLRIQETAKYKKMVIDLAEIIEDYDIHLGEERKNVKRIGPRERNEMKREEDTFYTDLSKLIKKYQEIKQVESPTDPTKRAKLEHIKKQLTQLPNQEIVKEQFHKWTKDKLELEGGKTK